MQALEAYVQARGLEWDNGVEARRKSVRIGREENWSKQLQHPTKIFLSFTKLFLESWNIYISKIFASSRETTME